MSTRSWSSTGRLDPAGDPIFLSPDGSLWAVSRAAGSVTQILERLRTGPAIPWSQRELVGHSDDWVVAVRPAEACTTPWPELVAWVAARLTPLGEDVMYHDWERGEEYLFRTRLDEDRATAIVKAVQERGDLLVQALPILAHLDRG